MDTIFIFLSKTLDGMGFDNTDSKNFVDLGGF